MGKKSTAIICVMMVMATASIALSGCTTASGSSSESIVTLKGG
ncbi:MAG: hypothetical protein O3A01_04680 [bacterium]|nr:hypothetical protein [bacterium]